MDKYTGTSTGMGTSGMGRKGRLKQKDYGMERSRNEDEVTSQIEKTTAKVPSVAFLSFAIGAMVGSLGFMLAGRRDTALFIATWVPTILILGNYNKMVKATEDIDTGGMEAWRDPASTF